jgi:hypothetical protein
MVEDGDSAADQDEFVHIAIGVIAVLIGDHAGAAPVVGPMSSGV